MNRQFVARLAANTGHAEQFGSCFDGLQEGQRPHLVSVCCSDSRVLQDHLWDNDDPGEIFTVGNIGNRVVQQTADGAAVSGDVLYPVEHTGTETVAVVGHTGCGAVTATYDSLTDGLSEPPGIEHCVGLLESELADGVELLPENLDRATAINHLVEYNVDRQIEFLRDSDDVPDSVDIAGLVYDFQDVYDGERGELHVVNVNGERDPETLRERHESISARISRRWRY